MKLFGKIPLYIHPAFWLLSFFIAWMSANTFLEIGVWMVVVFISVVVHELGHALTASFWNQRVHIELVPLGGYTVRHGPALGKLKEFVIVLMGPLAGFLLVGAGLLASSLHPTNPTVVYFLNILVIANIFWSVINLIPVHPLDGGKLLGIMMEALFGMQGLRISYLLSALLALLCTVFFFSIGAVIGGALFVLFAYSSFSAFLQQRQMRSSGDDDKVLEEIKIAEQKWHERHPEEATGQLEAIIKREPRGEASLRAVEALAGMLLASNETAKARALLLAHKTCLSTSMQKELQVASFKLGMWQEALEYGKQVFLESQDISCAVLNAYASAHLGHLDDAIQWLKAVKRQNPASLPHILEAEDLEPLRNDPHFQELKK